MAPQGSPILLWFRRDLRLEDNPALCAAAATGRPVIPVYVLDEALEGRPIGAAARWWLDKSLRALTAALEKHDARLILRRGAVAEVLGGLAAKTGATGVYWNRLYEPAAVARDERLTRGLQACGLEVRTFNGALLTEPGSVRTATGGAYKVFTPFSYAVRRSLGKAILSPAPERLPPAPSPQSEDLADWRLHPSSPDWSGGFGDWRPGEAGARDRLEQFLDRGLDRYATARDVPGVEGSSRLSPHLHWGEISPWRVYAAVRHAADAGKTNDNAVQSFTGEILWREFNAHLLAAFPTLPRDSFKPEFDAFPWRRDPEGFAAWSRGRTGYPLVDAGMRQLWATGWMHNRVRMIAASFLVKHLLIDWREGEAWFWDTLVDADLASNVGNWQWVAGSGADASPWFRIFNPTAQGRRFDPEGAYVRRWVPELAELPARLIHTPWEAPEAMRRGYPLPIVEHGAGRTRALAALAKTRVDDHLYQEGAA